MKKYNTKVIAMTGVLSALSIVLTLLIHFPIFPAVSFLEYDLGDVPIFISTILFGPAVGLIQTIIVSVLQGITVSAGSGHYGILMHIIATGTYTIALGFMTLNKKNDKKIIGGMALAVLCWVFVMIPANLIITPAFTGMPASFIASEFLVWIVLFNIIKSVANSILAFILYKALRQIFKRYMELGEDLPTIDKR